MLPDRKETPTTPTQIFGLQVVLSLLTYGLAARWYLLPRLERLDLVTALTPLLLFHTLRTIGLVFLVPGVIGGPLPAAFAAPGAGVLAEIKAPTPVRSSRNAA
jgi:hypothetical protein